jgi:hypothetical protein
VNKYVDNSSSSTINTINTISGGIRPAIGRPAFARPAMMSNIQMLAPSDIPTLPTLPSIPSQTSQLRTTDFSGTNNQV